jgi:hypothetical protein
VLTGGNDAAGVERMLEKGSLACPVCGGRLARWGYGLERRGVRAGTAGLQISTGEAAAARRMDAEDATMVQVLAWAMDHDVVMAPRLADALSRWWWLRGRLPGQYPLLRELAGRAEAGSDGWCAIQCLLGQAASFAADPPAALGYFTAVRDAVGDGGPSRVLADALADRQSSC